ISLCGSFEGLFVMDSEGRSVFGGVVEFVASVGGFSVMG
ncbi:hypothetical protein A2U01_0055328, partial [Trifolium medium]|nr:hypothetical protein [Trifolium medium]